MVIKYKNTTNTLCLEKDLQFGEVDVGRVSACELLGSVEVGLSEIRKLYHYTWMGVFHITGNELT